MDNIYFSKTNERTKLPAKREEDAGYDIYATISDEYMIVMPGETVKIPTGLHSAFPSSYVAILKERSSTASFGLSMRSGVIDSGYRGEWIICMTNCSAEPIVFHNYDNDEKLSERDFLFTHQDIRKLDFFKPYNACNAICQVVFVRVPELRVCEMNHDTLKNIPSSRGSGGFGSTNHA